MNAFFVSMIFLGVLLILGSLFFIVMDRVNGKDFFKEFDRKKEEMFNLIQDSEDMIQELNRMSDYVVTMISEKNQEYFEKINSQKNAGSYSPNSSLAPQNFVSVPPKHVVNAVIPNIKAQEVNIPEPVQPNYDKETAYVENTEQLEKKSALNKEFSAEDVKKEVKEEAISYEEFKAESKNDSIKDNDAKQEEFQNQNQQNQEPLEPGKEIVESVEMPTAKERKVNTQMSGLDERLNETETYKSRLTLNSRRKEVLKLIEQGLTNDEIADKLKIGKGEIGLIRGLSR